MLSSLTKGIAQDGSIPEYPAEEPNVPKAPVKKLNLSAAEIKLALANSLRYFPTCVHEKLASEFLNELMTLGHIYMLRYRPTEYEMKAYPLDEYPAKCKQAAAVMLMIMNNLDYCIAQFPHHLITYGGNGSVFQNWAQYHVTMKYLSEMTEEQTLVLYSGHPHGLFPSNPAAPRVIVTNGMVIPNYSSRAMYEKMYAMGNSQYGQMTAGSFCYIGPQGIVHGTCLTLMNACRKYLEMENFSNSGVVYVTSGLGGMSGAQPKAATIAGIVSVTAEIDENALNKRHSQGWVHEIISDVQQCIKRIREAKASGEAVSIGYLGNIVTIWEALANQMKEDIKANKPEKERLIVELGSDQTSLHNPFKGGYYPVQLTFEESRKMMAEDPDQFKDLVYESLRRQVSAINFLCSNGMHFWDYGNSFLLEASRAGADIHCESQAAAGSPKFRYPSYVQDIMGDIFSLGFGPFRWVCTSNEPDDLRRSDAIASRVIADLMETAPEKMAAQLKDNLMWINAAEENKMVVGSQARILYAHREARQAIALAFNSAIATGEIKSAIVLSRDHHDVSGTDSPFRETSNIEDGSAFCADMAIHNVIGDSFRGATWVAIHNGGGVGWGEVMNGGFGLVLDGSETAGNKAASMLAWDVNNGVSRRAWARNDNAILAIRREMEINPLLTVTLPAETDSDVLQAALSSCNV